MSKEHISYKIYIYIHVYMYIYISIYSVHCPGLSTPCTASRANDGLLSKFRERISSGSHNGRGCALKLASSWTGCLTAFAAGVGLLFRARTWDVGSRLIEARVCGQYHALTA